jgi:hypothetical protein
MVPSFDDWAPSHHVAPVIDAGSEVIASSQVAEVRGRAVLFPKHGVLGQPGSEAAERGIRAHARAANRLLAFVDPEGGIRRCRPCS